MCAAALLHLKLLFMAKKKVVEEATIEQEKTLNSIVENKKDIVEIRGTKFSIGWMRNRTRRKVTDIFLEEKDEDKVSSKCAAAFVLNGYFKIKFFYWFLWRWFYYVKQYSDKELMPLVELCKKKAQPGDYFLITIYLTEMRDTIKSMTREEVSRIRQESFMAQRGQSGKNTPVSPNP